MTTVSKKCISAHPGAQQLEDPIVPRPWRVAVMGVSPVAPRAPLLLGGCMCQGPGLPSIWPDPKVPTPGLEAELHGGGRGTSLVGQASPGLGPGAIVFPWGRWGSARAHLSRSPFQVGRTPHPPLCCREVLIPGAGNPCRAKPGVLSQWVEEQAPVQPRLSYGSQSPTPSPGTP